MRLTFSPAIFGPAAHWWFSFLQSHVKFQSQRATTLARVATDQVVFSTSNLALFLSTMSALEPSQNGNTAKDRVQDRLQSTYVTALSKNWMVWPFVQVVNFSFVPVEHRVMVVNVVALGWNCYLSYLNSQGGKPKSELVEETVSAKAKELKKT